jgi:hypothetical protein
MSVARSSMPRCRRRRLYAIGCALALAHRHHRAPHPFLTRIEVNKLTRPRASRIDEAKRDFR